MGIKFSCPNGHRLNVKAFLAGKRAKCPRCGAKVLVPTGVNGSEEDDEFEPNPPAIPASQARSPVTKVPPSPGAPAPTATADIAPWFVRDPTGGQYGPASDAVIADWYREGRIAPDAWVWREGWAEWQPADRAMPQLGLRTPASREPEPLREPGDLFDLAAADESIAKPRQRNKHDRNVLVSGTLGVATVILLVILIWILSKAG